MKVGVIAEQLRQEVPGGIGTYLTGLLRGLEELHAPDIEVIALASRPHGDEPLAASGNRIRIVFRWRFGTRDGRLQRFHLTYSISHLSPVRLPRRIPRRVQL